MKIQTLIQTALITLIVTCAAFRAGAEVIPPAPEHDFNDYANVVNGDIAKGIVLKLEQFKKDTASRIIVAIFPKMQSDASAEDYGRRVVDAWKDGLKDKNIGLVLLIFVQDHQMSLQAGPALKKTVTDATCQKIIDDEILSRFKNGNFDDGLMAGVNAMIAAAHGEYKGAEAKAAPAPSESGK